MSSGPRLRLASRWPTYALLIGSVTAILVGGFVLPQAVGTADRPAAPAVSTTLVPPGPPVDHDTRPPPKYADLALVTSPPPVGAALTASDVGVSATAVTVGVILPSLGSVAAFGVDVSQLDPKIQRSYWDAAVSRVNAAGGVAGRHLEVVYATGDILSADSVRAACRSLTEDHRVSPS